MTRGTSPDPDDLTVGETGPLWNIESVTTRDFVRYAGASGDFNPVHYDETYAATQGYDSVFGQGMFSAGLVASASTAWFGMENITEFHLLFNSLLHPHTKVEVVSEIETVVSRPDTVKVTAAIDLIASDGTRIAVGEVGGAIPD